MRQNQRIVLILVLLGLSANPMNAQSVEPESPSKKRQTLVEFHAGFNVNRVSGSEISYLERNAGTRPDGMKQEDRVGWELGVNHRYPLGRTSFVRYGLQLTQRRTSLPNTNYVLDPLLRTSYLGIPLLVGASSLPMGDSRVSVGIELGAVAMLAMSDKSYDPAEEKNTIDFAAGLLLDFQIADGYKICLRYRWLRNLTSAYAVGRSAGGQTTNGTRVPNILYTDFTYSSNAISVSLCKIQ